MECSRVSDRIHTLCLEPFNINSVFVAFKVSLLDTSHLLTVWHEIFAGVYFRGLPFYAFRGKKSSQIWNSDFTVGNKFSRFLRKFLSGISHSAPVRTKIAT